MAKQSDAVYWDSCVIIDYLEKNERFHHIEPIVRQAIKKGLYVVVSTVCYAEVFKVNGESNDAASKLIAQFFEQPYVIVSAASERTMRKAAEIRKRVSLETADAIHVATALERGVSAFLTRDGVKHKPGKKSILSLAPELVGSLRIITPQEYFNQLNTDIRQEEIPDSRPDKQRDAQ